MLVIVRIRTEARDLTSHVKIGSESYCLLGQLKRTLELSDSEAGIKVVKSGGVDGEMVSVEKDAGQVCISILIYKLDLDTQTHAQTDRQTRPKALPRHIGRW